MKEKQKKGINTPEVQRFMKVGKGSPKLFSSDKKTKEDDDKKTEGKEENEVRDGPMIIEEVEIEEKNIDEVEENTNSIHESESDVENMKVKDLKRLISLAGLQSNDCHEKSELIERAKKAKTLLNQKDDEVEIEEKEEEEEEEAEMFQFVEDKEENNLESKADSTESLDQEARQRAEEERERERRRREDEFDEMLPPRFRRKKMPFNQWLKRQLKITAVQFVGIFILFIASSMLGYGPLWEDDPENVVSSSSSSPIQDVLDDEDFGFENSYVGEL